MKTAWRTKAAGVESIVAAETRGKAIAMTLRSAREVGYKVEFHEVRATRAPEHNPWAAVDSTGICWGEEFLPATIAKADGSKP